MTEADLSRRVAKWLRHAAAMTNNPTLKWERHESSTVRSVPDVRLRWAGFAAWIELKVAKGRLIRFQSGQARWLTEEWTIHPGESWILVGIPRHSKRSAGLSLYRGEQAFELQAVGISLEPELHFDDPIALPQWGELLDRFTWGGCYCRLRCTEGTAHGI